MRKSLLLVVVLYVLTMFLLSGCISQTSMSIQYLGHSNFVITDSSGTSLGLDCFDPTAFKYSEDTPADIGLSDSNKFDYLAFTHNHDDHNKVPQGMTSINRNLSNKEAKAFGKMNVSRYFNEHYPPGTRFGKERNGSILVEVNGVRVLHLGDPFGTMNDMAKLKEFKKAVGEIDILLIPIDDWKSEQIEFELLNNTIEILNPGVSIPMHYFLTADKKEFLKKATEAGYEVIDFENNIKTLNKKELPESGKKLIWSLKPGSYQKQ